MQRREGTKGVLLLVQIRLTGPVQKCSRCFAVYSTPESVNVQGDIYEGLKCERVNGWSKPCVSPDCSGRGALPAK